ncbi:hypothetical protein phiOC_p217 [Ochrobactrum phage vB_OspM_OC]|nr:hypothetical protein phiOC_p217 [Ochrobactrum phage vB_OspM_OC]
MQKKTPVDELYDLLVKYDDLEHPFVKTASGNYHIDIRHLFVTDVTREKVTNSNLGIIPISNPFLRLERVISKNPHDTLITLRREYLTTAFYELRLTNASHSMAACYYYEYQWGSVGDFRKITLIEHIDKNKPPDACFHFKNGTLPFVSIELTDPYMIVDIFRVIRLNHEIAMLENSNFTFD